MLLILHISIALSSLAVAGLAYFKPNQTSLRTSYALVGLTAATGTILTIQMPAHLMQTCATGLVYLGVVFTAIVSARQKLANN